MKISTRKSYTTRSSKPTTPTPRKAPTGKKTTQKIAKNRLSLRALFARARRYGKLTGIACIAGVLIFIGIQIYHSDKFRVQRISIYGCKMLDPQKVERIVKDSIPQRILDIDFMELKNRLKLEPWIKDVAIRRVLPSGLTIYVDERTPCVVIEMQGQLMMTDNDGILLDRYEPGYGKLDVPIFKGVAGNDIDSYRSSQMENSLRVKHALDMLAEIESGEPQLVHEISEVDISEFNNLKIMLVGDTCEIWLGEKDYLKRFRDVLKSAQYAQYKNNPDLLEVDVSLGTSISYRFAEDSSVAVPSKAEGN